MLPNYSAVESLQEYAKKNEIKYGKYALMCITAHKYNIHTEMMNQQLKWSMNVRIYQNGYITLIQI